MQCSFSETNDQSDFLAAQSVEALTIGATSPANATAGTNYSGSVGYSGGFGIPTFSIGAGSLPAGIQLNASTGVLPGTPATAGSYAFTVTTQESSRVAQTVSETMH